QPAVRLEGHFLESLGPEAPEPLSPMVQVEVVVFLRFHPVLVDLHFRPYVRTEGCPAAHLQNEGNRRLLPEQVDPPNRFVQRLLDDEGFRRAIIAGVAPFPVNTHVASDEPSRKTSAQGIARIAD